MKLRLLALGKLKNLAFRDLTQDYLGRIQKFYPMDLEEIAEESWDPKQGKKALQKEGARLLKRLKPNTHLILLEEKGRQMRSVEWAKSLAKFFNSGISEIAWVIGSAYGLDDSLRKRAQETWSLSKLTLPHEMARVFFLEQLYRAITIQQGLPYHHE